MNARGDSPIEIDDLVGQIKNYLTDLPGRFGKGRFDGEWTTEVKRGIGEIGRSAGLLALASGYPTPDDREWLYDLIWFKNAPDHHLERLIMALESEWVRDPDEILYDFEKLLVARASIKVMVFQDHGENLSLLWSLFDKGMRTYQQDEGDALYLWTAFREVEHAFVFKKATMQEVRAGKISLI